MDSKFSMATKPYSAMAGTLDARLLKSIEVMGFTSMTPVQQKVLTELPTFKTDCLCQAKTGTGKTLAFLLPCLQTLLTSAPVPKGQVAILVISPTRELALQIAKECDQLTSQLDRPYECHTAFGGTSRNKHLTMFMNGAPTILVATPGRLKDYLSEARIASKFGHMRTLILDEADTMLESGFLEDVRRILDLVPPKRLGWQGMCFSATIPPRVKEVVECVLSPGYANISTVDKSEPPTIERVPQFHVLYSDITESFRVLTSLLDHESANSNKIIVFGVTANMVALYAQLFSQGLTKLPVYELHSRLSQSTRTRTTEAFKVATSGIMFASDVIGRGMDFPNVDLVVQVGIPSSGDQYVHRVGRTGRAGSDGCAIILLTHAESFFLKNNRNLPVAPHAHTQDIVNKAQLIQPQVEHAMNRIGESTKQRAYSSFLGFFAGSGLLKPLHLDKTGLVVMANRLAVQGMCCPDPPPMEKKTVGKMGLKGVSGFNYAVGNTKPPISNDSGNRNGQNRVHNGSGTAQTLYQSNRSMALDEISTLKRPLDERAHDRQPKEFGASNNETHRFDQTQRPREGQMANADSSRGRRSGRGRGRRGRGGASSEITINN